MFQEDGSSSVTSSSPQLFPMMSPPPSLMSPYPWLKELKPEERGLYLIHLLVACGNHVASGGFENANTVLDQISYLASPQGDTMQRIASYFSEALADRVLRAWPGIYKAFHSNKIPVFAEQIFVKKLFSEYLLFTKIAFVISNQSIIESMEGEKVIHIIDLNATEPNQWRALILDLSARPEGPPHLRITGIHQKKEILDHMAHMLTEEAEKLDLPFQFNPVLSKLEDLDFDELRVKTGEALAISSTLQLHTLLASDDDNTKLSPCSNIDIFLSGLWGLSPKVVVVTEQEADHNGPGLTERLSGALYYYAALFDCLESTFPRSSLQRLKMEKTLLGEEIKNIIACEGAERRERHEKMERWGRRLELARFRNVGLSYHGMLQAKRLMQSCKCDGYRIKEENGCVLICWQDRPILSVSAWRFRR
ncbi:hypothetical protein CASFOL_035257 [Castilleja foliolosa]|uniref:Scarecrow-like protein 3 n=1 Tax=Castilleja foliolosa TaxID=1961234 RepID=A0ABD3BSC2_9LAMI